ncbi:competence protein CoiA [Viridibacillus arvi]|uniref:competence protein CoiA n=1 Tax=Viridibacillus arvi TaxID=263475 RepID=UPI003D27ECB9
MLVAVDMTGKKRIALLEDKDELKMLSSSNQLSCPQCHRRAFFHAGVKKLFHFKHESHVECINDGEPETFEHLNGKLLIYKWLKDNYSEAKIELEHRINKTNQIADVYACFPDGQSYAFEIQCSFITEEKWTERSLLYKQANIIDFWLFGSNFYKEVPVKSDEIGTKLKLKSLLIAVNRRKRDICFIDVEQRSIKQVGTYLGISRHTETYFEVDIHTYSIQEMQIYQTKILGNSKTFSKYEEWSLSREDEASRLWERRKKNRLSVAAGIAAANERKRLFRIKQETYTKQFLNHFDINNLMSTMTRIDRDLFHKLITKHRLTTKNFPGIFKIFLEHSEYVYTPYPLWQLWIYDRYIYSNNNLRKNVWPEYIYKDFKGVFRISKKHGYEIAILIKEYLIRLSQVGILETNSYNTYKKPFKIKSYIAPIIIDFNKNSYLAFILSDLYSSDYFEDKQSVNVINTLENYRKLVQLEIERPAKVDTALFDYVFLSIEEGTMILDSNETTFFYKLFGRVYDRKKITIDEYNTFTTWLEWKSQEQ